ncbi:hypothetical protein ACFYZ9_03380 [Streptomyces sp. NPDC001691]|uniref:hypothetical protein n=1 Tax=Streptomyces sp. NPDC001691 TaxID=3364600 RepID=UPI0036AE0A73
MWAVAPGPVGPWWVPEPGELVKDTRRGRLGEAVAWDAGTRAVTLVPLKGGEQWETDEFRPLSELDRLRARTFEDVALVSRLELNEGKREMEPLPSAEPRHERADD